MTLFAPGRPTLFRGGSSRKRTRAYAAVAGACLIAGGLAVIAATAADYGVAWDDYVQSRYGELVLDYFLSGGQDRACNEFLDLKFYAPTFEIVAAAAARLCPARAIELRHTLCGVVALLAIPPLIGFGRLLGRPWLGVMASVILFLCPVFYGHGPINSKDIPFAVGMLWSMFALARLFAKNQFGWNETIAAGLAVGLSVSIRPGGWSLLLPLYVVIAVWCDWRSRCGGRPAKRPLLKQAVLLGTAWAIMVLPWPWAHENPWSHPLQAIRMASKFHVVVPVLFEGRVIPSDQLPRHYLLAQLVLTLPPAVLLMAAVGIAAAASGALRRLNRPRTTVLVAIAAWFALPLALFIALRPNAYDGMRHFLFLLPAVALWSAYGCQWVWSRWPGRAPRVGFAAALAVAAVLQVQSLVQLHPYQMAYFNFLAGGVGGAVERYDTEGWLISYKEAMEWIKRQPVPQPGEPIVVLVAANENSRWCAAAFADERLSVEATTLGGQRGDLPEGIDYYIGTCRSSMGENFDAARVVYQVQRQGAVFTTIKRAARGDDRAEAASK
jgi:4-amino-4-deoxy-L-arabinose transferase-like glycosyltransferase